MCILLWAEFHSHFSAINPPFAWVHSLNLNIYIYVYISFLLCPLLSSYLPVLLLLLMYWSRTIHRSHVKTCWIPTNFGTLRRLSWISTATVTQYSLCLQPRCQLVNLHIRPDSSWMLQIISEGFIYNISLCTLILSWTSRLVGCDVRRK